MAARKILILNSGSSSLKYNLFNNDENFSQITKGNINIIKNGSTTEDTPKSHAEAIEHVEKQLVEKYGCKPEDLLFIAHRVVHGGEEFTDHAASEVDEKVLKKIEELSLLAPLHNPVNLLGIKECEKIYQGVPQFAVFDTSFHSTLPPQAYKYAMPSVVSSKVRRYGFHGTSHKYVGRKAAEMLGKPVEQTKVITLHLGNGASACAIKNGKSIDTSMGMTPLEGLVMGTRCGDIDPAAVFHLITKQNKQIDWSSDHEAFLHIEDMLNKEAGLKGLCGSSDMRDIQDKMSRGDESAKLAFEVFVYRIKRYIGSYFVALEGCDAIVFTAGIGENSALVRHGVCQGLSCIGVELDEEVNKQVGGKGKRENTDVSKPDSKVRVLVIFTDEEREIASLALQEYNLNRQK